MLEQSLIAREQYDAAVAEPVPSRRDVQPPREDTKYPYFTSWIKQQVVDKLGGGQTGARQAFEGGLTVQTTIDGRFQKAADDAIRAWLPNPAGPRASLVAIDNKSGEVRAMVGGDDYNTTPFNLATQGQRQPGSAFKPFVLAEALKRGISPGSVWSSRKKVFDVPGSTEKFTVENYNDAYAGVTSLAAATTTSDNSVYRRGRHQGRHEADREAGPPHGHPHAGLAQLGDDARRPQGGRHAARHGARLPDVRARGQVRLRLDEPGRAAQGPAGPGPGRHPPRSPGRDDDKKLKPVRLPNGRPARNRVRTKRVLDEGVASTRRQRSCRAWSRTAPARARSSARVPVAGKTGTTENYGDAWFVGWTRDYTVAVWVGYPNKLDADEDRVQGRAGRRRHLPGRDLEDVHGVGDQDRPAGGAQGQGRRRRRGRRPRLPAPPSPPPPRRRPSRASPRPRPTAAAARPSRSRRTRRPSPSEPADIPPAEQAPAPPTAPENGETAPSGGTAPPAELRASPARAAPRCRAAPAATASTPSGSPPRRSATAAPPPS